MAYIGNAPVIGQWRKLDDISSGFNGSSTSFTTQVGGVNVVPGSANQLIVSLGGVIQEPDVDYTVSSAQITFTTAPVVGLSFFALLAGDALNAGTPSDGTVTTPKLASQLSINLAAATPASATATGTAGDIVWDVNYIYVCTATNTWKRVAISTW